MKHIADFEKKEDYPIITMGVVEDVSDAYQMGRIKVRCVAWLDARSPTEDLPSVRLCSPYYGYKSNVSRGVNGDISSGPIAYGQWHVPEVGSQVLVTLIDNDPTQRVYLGNVPDLFSSHTLPHGRYLDEKLPMTSTESPIEPLASNVSEAFEGKVDSAEYATRVMDRQVSAFPSSLIGDLIKISSQGDQQQQLIQNEDGSIINRTQGYVDGNSSIYSNTTPGFHSMSMDDDPNNCRIRFRTTSGHQIILDDTNERIYVSTAKGKTWIEIDEQGTIDIYGEQDISISSDADVNIRAKDAVRISGGNGIHMTSGSDIRMHSKADTHVKADGDFRLHSNNIRFEADADFISKITGVQDTTANSIVINSETNYDLTVKDSFKLSSDGYEFSGNDLYVINGNIITGQHIHATGNITSTGTISTTGGLVGGSVSASGSISATGSIAASGLITSSADVVAGNVSLLSHLHLVPLPAHIAGTIPSPPPVPSAASLPVVSSPQAPTVGPVTLNLTPASGSAADEKPAYFVSRVPQHEPFTRTYLSLESTDIDTVGETTLDLFDKIETDIDSVSEHASTDSNAGRGSSSRGKDFIRNPNWRR